MILIIDKRQRERSAVAEMFHYMGILSYAADPAEALAEISPLYSAVLFSSLSGIADVPDYLDRLRAYCEVPIFALEDYEYELSSEVLERLDGVFSSGMYSSSIAVAISRRTVDFHGNVLGEYRLAGIDASVELPEVLFLGQSVPLTKTERMILRYLIRAYPTAASPREILKYAFRGSRAPEPSSVRTHISVMNRKFREYFGRPLTLPGQGTGYAIATPDGIQRQSALSAI